MCIVQFKKQSFSAFYMNYLSLPSLRRLSAAVHGLQLRLKDTHYLSTHRKIEKGLKHWCTAAYAGLCALYSVKST